jgi:IclR family KDG regulon transcriptional repressor
MRIDLESQKSGGEQRRLSSVTNAMRLLKTFSNERYEIGISDLGAQLQLSKSTVHRLANALVDAGLLEQSPKNSKYRLGGVLLELSYVMHRSVKSQQKFDA